jgi:hypothetical protein
MIYKSWLSEDGDLDRYALAADILRLGEDRLLDDRKKLVGDWRAAVDTSESHVNDRSDSKAGLPECAKGLKVFTRECGHKQAVVIRCGKPTCPDCERLRAAEAVARWGPIIEKMKHPKMLVLAVQSSQSLELAGALLEWAFARFMDLRIGGRNRAGYKLETQAFITEHAAEFDKHHAADNSRRSADQWRESCDRFWDDDIDNLWSQQRAKAEKQLAACNAELKLDGRGSLAGQFMRFDVLRAKRDRAEARVRSFDDGIKVRDLLFGIRPLEVTWNAFSGWHPHYHLAIDSIYLPFPAVLVLWMRACTISGGASVAALADPDEDLQPGECFGRTAHISALRSPKEVLKYVTKHVDHRGELITASLPAEKKQELEEYLKGKKRVWPIGNAKPKELPKAACPGCGDNTCKCDRGETVKDYCAADIWKTAGGDYLRVLRVKGKGLVWERLAVSDGGEAAPFSSHMGDCLTVPRAGAPGDSS